MQRHAVGALAFALIKMAKSVPSVLALGHSFVLRLHRDLLDQFDPQADRNFNLEGTSSVYLHCILCGRSHAVRRIAPDVVILENGSTTL